MGRAPLVEPGLLARVIVLEQNVVCAAAVPCIAVAAEGTPGAPSKDHATALIYGHNPI